MKTLPYWKYWKKTECLQNFFLSEAEEIAEEGGEVVVDETVAKLIAGESEAIRDKIAGGEAAHDNTVGERVDED